MAIEVPLPNIKASEGTRSLYDMVQACPSNKVILIDSSWDQGSKPECLSQVECVVKDLCRRNIKFVVMSTTSLYAPTFAMEVIEPITAEAGYEYGRDWVNLGFLGFVQTTAESEGVLGLLIDAFCRDVHATRPRDYRGTAIEDLPLMQRVKTAEDLHLVVAVNYCPALPWISFGRGQHNLSIAFGCAAIMSPYYYVYMDSGQLCGLLTGNRGSYEYEQLCDSRGTGSTLMMAFAFGHCFIILAALMGNVGYLAARELQRRGA
jgi:hypothetical protein